MRVINIHEAKTHLSRLVEQAAAGESFVIAKAGKPMVRVVAIGPEAAKEPPSRLGFLQGQFKVPADFDTMGQEEIEAMFYGEE
ncbi:type II toxin-antitoxin system Phd/YefM family antitoxin [Pararhizobium sp.]|uniref:type II toxin-antitoxin system Phd/YefM family antitoxin n=1 Tax=Pararhizobium sp. TaxID=1977563 RepID=UPI00271B1A5B|nr:type II toxin-antitoxin system prevent-host-death family antitoxin [Pararhizobium sp.]MDO9415961.1 type II toxin-antitoxin system prevent-host-death family antitoxin [Pararhizobium sp.]